MIPYAMKPIIQWVGSSRRRHAVLGLLASACVMAAQYASAAVTIVSDDFENYSNVATNLEDTADADPVRSDLLMIDDDPAGGTAKTGVQVINWQAHGGTNSMLVKAGSEAQYQLLGARSGSRYQLDFWLNTAKGSGNRNFYIILRGEGSDNNGDDYLAYRSDRAATPNIFYYDGVGPGAGAWVNSGVTHTDNVWQHHRIVIDPNALTFNLYLDDMDTPVITDADLSRPDAPVPTVLRVLNEGDSADDGYFLIDDISLTVDDSRDLAATLTENFESYTARTSADDNANPAGPWITTEVLGAGAGKERAPGRVQVVGSDVVPAHSGTKCLKLEGGQRASASLAWGVPPQSDVQITWWARVPASVAGATALYLRMSLYGAENGNVISGDNALFGYGSRQAGIGDETSLCYYITGWLDAGMDYTPDTWEEYRLVTHTSQGRYTITKNPSSANPQIVVDRAPFIGTATNWVPVIMAAWSSSNGSDHPPVYIDDVEIKSLVSTVDPIVDPYTTAIQGTRFTNVTTLALGGTIGSVTVDPRDNSTILYSVDAATGGAIMRAVKTASGTWTVDPTPVVAGLVNPTGLVIDQEGTLWWTHDVTMTLMKLKWPWSSNVPEKLIADFGNSTTTLDDDPIDVTIAPANFNGALGKPGMIIVADRGADADANNAVYYYDPANTNLSQINYNSYLVNPTPSDLGSGNLNAIVPLAESGEVLTLSQDGCLTAINGDGGIRSIWTTTLWADTSGLTPAGVAMAVDPKDGRVWIADDNLHEVWSVSVSATAPTPDQKEIAFPLTNPLRTAWQIDFNDPGMAFAGNGGFMVLSDSSTVNGGGRLVIFHNDPKALPAFRMKSITRTASGVQLEWESVSGVKYRVQRGSTVTSFQDLSGDLTETSFTDTNAPAEAAFYRISVAQ